MELQLKNFDTHVSESQKSSVIHHVVNAAYQSCRLLPFPPFKVDLRAKSVLSICDHYIQ